LSLCPQLLDDDVPFNPICSASSAEILSFTRPSPPPAKGVPMREERHNLPPCSVCAVRPSDAYFVGCAHLGCCMVCEAEVSRCPLCQSMKATVLRVTS
jgi:hypothetical protein